MGRVVAQSNDVFKCQITHPFSPGIDAFRSVMEPMVSRRANASIPVVFLRRIETVSSNWDGRPREFGRSKHRTDVVENTDTEVNGGFCGLTEDDGKDGYFNHKA